MVWKPKTWQPEGSAWTPKTWQPEGETEAVGVQTEIDPNRQARVNDILMSFPSLYDSPMTPKQRETISIDRPDHMEEIWLKTGRDRGQIARDFLAVDVTPDAWGVKTPEEARDLVLKRAMLEGKRTLGEELVDDPLIDALAILPFSPLHDWEKLGYREAKRKLATGDYSPTATYGFGPAGFMMTMPPQTTKQLRGIIRDYELEQARGMTAGAQIGKGVVALPSYIGEFAVGGAMAKGLGLSVGTTASKAPAVVKLAKQIGSALGQAGITTVIQPHRVTSALIDQELAGETGMTALAKAYGATYIENLTELTGEAFNNVGVGIIKRLPFGGKLLSRLTAEAKRLGLSEDEFLGKIAKKGGWNGFLGEVGEERINTILYGIFSIDDFGAGPDSGVRDRIAAGLKQDMEAQNLLVESAILLTPGGVKILAKQVAQRMPSNQDIEVALDALEQANVQDQANQVAEQAQAAPKAAQKATTAAPETQTPAEAPAAGVEGEATQIEARKQSAPSWLETAVSQETFQSWLRGDVTAETVVKEALKFREEPTTTGGYELDAVTIREEGEARVAEIPAMNLRLDVPGSHAEAYERALAEGIAEVTEAEEEAALIREAPSQQATPESPRPSEGGQAVSQPQVSEEAISSEPPNTQEVLDTTEGPAPEMTSARQVMLNEDRQAMGLAGVNSKSRRGWRESLMQARKRQIPQNAAYLAAEIEARPRPMDDVETAGMVLRLAELKRQHNDLGRQLEGSNYESMTKELAGLMGRVENEFDLLSKALYHSGSEKGRALASQKLTLNADMSLIAVKRRAKAAKGAELTKDQAEKFTKLTNALAEKEEELERFRKEVAKLKAGQATKKSQSKSRKYANMSKSQITAERASLINKVRELADAGCYDA